MRYHLALWREHCEAMSPIAGLRSLRPRLDVGHTRWVERTATMRVDTVVLRLF